MDGIKVFAFSAGWDLPTTGPFALKLVKWLDLAGLPYRLVAADNPGKGPKGKNPWVELDGRTIGDSEVIIDILAMRSGFDIDAGLSTAERAISLAVRRMLEEHFHQVLEWELFVHPEGAAFVRGEARKKVPAPLAGPMAAMFSRHFRRQLHARGMARHDDGTIAAKGVADLDALEGVLGDRPFLLGDRPSMADLSAYGLVAPMARWPMRTPVATNIKARPRLMAYLDRIQAAGAGMARAA